MKKGKNKKNIFKVTIEDIKDNNTRRMIFLEIIKDNFLKEKGLDIQWAKDVLSEIFPIVKEKIR